MWWDGAVGYEVYIRSFADSDGDGIGDFPGLTARLDHLAWLGIDLVWVTPFYPSPQADFGYDVSDYTAVDPAYGSLADFDRFVQRATELGLRVMVDIVPNHTSHLHPWFQTALADPDSPQRRYYIFRSPGPGGGPPNNWVSHFGGPAWTRDEASGDYYCHLFLPEQPDLDWANPAVRREFDRILGFWLARGVAGFRIDVAHALMKHPDLPDNPQTGAVAADATPAEAFAAFEHAHDLGREETNEVFGRWKRLPGADGAVLVGEVYIQDVDKSASYLGRGGLDLCLFFGLNRRPWDPAGFVDAIRTWSEAAPGGFAWTIASHDESRPPTRFGGGARGRGRALSIWTLFCSLPGLPFVYQGEELGLEDGHVRPEDVQDPVGQEAYHEGRDPCRTPMPWEDGAHAGFTTGRPWLTASPRTETETVAHQRRDPTSHLHRFRELLLTRRRLALPRREGTEWLPSPPGVGLVLTGDILTMANLDDREVPVDLPAGAWRLEFDSHGRQAGPARDRVLLPPATGRIYSAV